MQAVIKMGIDLIKIKEIAKEKEDENWKFRTFLKRHDMPLEQMDSMVHRLYERVSSEIDCTACGNCCREISPSLNQKDIERLSRGLAIPPDQFINQFLVEDKENFSDGFLFNKRPCPFLSGNICAYYDLRPESCSSYPHLHKEGFVFRLIGVIQNYEICPIVFNVFELLKAEIWGRGA